MKIYIFFIFDIGKSKRSKNIKKKINLKQERNFKIFKKHGWAAKTNDP